MRPRTPASAARPQRRRRFGLAALSLVLACNHPPGLAPPADRVLVVRGDGQEAEVSDTLRIPPAVEVVDQRGRPVAGAAVTFRVVEGGGSIEAVPALSDANGRVAATRWVLGPEAGPNVVEARVEGLAPGRFTARGLAVVAVAVGLQHSCLLDTDGAAWCWGDGWAGRLGTGDTVSSRVPRQVAGGLRFASLTAAWYHTCGLTPGGAAYCWGDNLFGELGDGRNQDAWSPSAVAGGDSFTGLSAGPYATCGVDRATNVLCWGYLIDANLHAATPVLLGMDSVGVPSVGYLGDVCAISVSGAPRCIVGPGGYFGGVTDVDLLTTGHVFLCGASRSLGLVCQGVGGGPVIPISLPAPADHLSEHRSQWSGTLQEADSGCVSVITAGVFCWSPKNGPAAGVLVPGTQALGPIASLATDQGHGCVVNRRGEAWCWGQNDYGQLGDGTLDPSAAPVRVHLFNKGRVPPP